MSIVFKNCFHKIYSFLNKKKELQHKTFLFNTFSKKEEK